MDELGGAVDKIKIGEKVFDRIGYEAGKAIDARTDNKFGRLYGGVCLSDKNCYSVSYCERRAGVTAAALGSLSLDGQCRPTTWAYLFLASFIILLLFGCCSCCRSCRSEVAADVAYLKSVKK